MKEFRDIATVKSEHGHKLEITTIVITIARVHQGDRRFGVSIQQSDTDGDKEGSAFIDFDEIDELIAGLAYMDGAARKLAGQERDYTEFIYSTKDGLRIGFYQSQGEQQAFIDVGGNGRSAFLGFERLAGLKSAMESAKAHLIRRGAGEGDSHTRMSSHAP
jgi:hypothetical protein